MAFVHFHHSDDRFCRLETMMEGTDFTTESDEVTCSACKFVSAMIDAGFKPETAHLTIRGLRTNDPAPFLAQHEARPFHWEWMQDACCLLDIRPNLSAVLDYLRTGKNELPILFRKSEGEVTAVFPTIPSDNYGDDMTCYAHIGQHSGCCMGWYHGTTKATPDEYKDLLSELESDGVGYKNLRVMHRLTHDMSDQRRRYARVTGRMAERNAKKSVA